MQNTIYTIPDTDIVFFKRNGPVSLKDRVVNRKCILDYCVEKKLKKVIVDTKDQHSKLSLLECFNFGAETAILMKQIKIAVLHLEEDESIAYTVNSAKSRGMQIQAFSKMDDAIDWLSK